MFYSFQWRRRGSKRSTAAGHVFTICIFCLTRYFVFEMSSIAAENYVARKTNKRNPSRGVQYTSLKMKSAPLLFRGNGQGDASKWSPGDFRSSGAKH